jgi:hypothetical protein
VIEWIKKNIDPPGVGKPNRLALFCAIGCVMERVLKDAEKAFYAHFPYLADDKKLAEHGKALLVPRLLHDTPEEYRTRVATASFFLMKAGERNYIMGQLEERFGQRFIVLENFLAIQTKVADLTDDERTWALDLFDSLTDPNIYLELSEWFHYFDALQSRDTALYAAERRDFDLFDNTIFRNGRILRDGQTILDAKIKVLRKGECTHDGSLRHTAHPIPESVMSIRRNSHDTIRIILPARITDTQTARIPRNGLLRRNGDARHTRMTTGFEALPPLGVYTGWTDAASIQETASALSMGNNTQDVFRNIRKHDGTVHRNTMARRSNDVVDVFQPRAVCDAAFQESVLLCDTSTFRLQKHHHHNGIYRRASGIRHDGMLLLPEAQIA